MDVINHIAKQYELATHHWFHYLFPIANRLFAMLATIEIAWAGIWWAIERNEITNLFAELLRKILMLGLCYAALLHANEWIPAILKSFMLIGSGAAHTPRLYPSDILGQGVALAGQMLGLLTLKGLLLNIFAQVITIVVAFGVVICYALIAAQVLVVQVESYIVVGAGVLLLGFSGHSFTRQISLNYFNYAISVGVQLFILFMIVGVGSQVTQSWSKSIALSGLGDPATVLELLGGALVFLFVVWVIPSKAQGLLNGAMMMPNRSLTAIYNQTKQWFKQKNDQFSSTTHSTVSSTEKQNYQTATAATKKHNTTTFSNGSPSSHGVGLTPNYRMTSIVMPASPRHFDFNAQSHLNNQMKKTRKSDEQQHRSNS